MEDQRKRPGKEDGHGAEVVVQADGKAAERVEKDRRELFFGQPVRREFQARIRLPSRKLHGIVIAIALFNATDRWLTTPLGIGYLTEI
jgi:hypothetical protein